MSLTYPPDSLQSEPNMIAPCSCPQVVPWRVSCIRAEEFLAQMVDSFARHNRHG